MSVSEVSSKVEEVARGLRRIVDAGEVEPAVRQDLEAMAERLEILAEPRGGVELGHVCGECSVLIDDDEVESIDECTNCNQPFYEL